MDTFSGPPARALALIPRAMQPHADRIDTDTVTFVGPCFDTRADTDGWVRPAAADHVLLISLGSAYTRRPAFYRQCITAFGDLPGGHVVLQIGKYTDPGELGAIPPNVEVHSWVPQRAILNRPTPSPPTPAWAAAAKGSSPRGPAGNAPCASASRSPAVRSTAEDGGLPGGPESPERGWCASTRQTYAKGMELVRLSYAIGTV